jgi:hypothetical protein
VRPIHLLGSGYAVTNPIDSRVVVAAEVAVGFAVAAAVLVRRRSSSRTRASA